MATSAFGLVFEVFVNCLIIVGWQSNDPILRMKRYMIDRGLWDDARDKDLHRDSRKEVVAAMKVAEKAKKPPVRG